MANTDEDERIEEYLRENGKGTDLDAFRKWLTEVNELVMETYENHLFDLEDVMIRSAFDEGMSPDDFFGEIMDRASLP